MKNFQLFLLFLALPLARTAQAMENSSAKPAANAPASISLTKAQVDALDFAAIHANLDRLDEYTPRTRDLM